MRQPLKELQKSTANMLAHARSTAKIMREIADCYKQISDGDIYQLSLDGDDKSVHDMLGELVGITLDLSQAYLDAFETLNARKAEIILKMRSRCMK